MKDQFEAQKEKIRKLLDSKSKVNDVTVRLFDAIQLMTLVRAEKDMNEAYFSAIHLLDKWEVEGDRSIVSGMRYLKNLETALSKIQPLLPKEIALVQELQKQRRKVLGLIPKPGSEHRLQFAKEIGNAVEILNNMPFPIGERPLAIEDGIPQFSTIKQFGEAADNIKKTIDKVNADPDALKKGVEETLNKPIKMDGLKGVSVLDVIHLSSMLGENKELVQSYNDAMKAISHSDYKTQRVKLKALKLALKSALSSGLSLKKTSLKVIKDMQSRHEDVVKKMHDLTFEKKGQLLLSAGEFIHQLGNVPFPVTVSSAGKNEFGTVIPSYTNPAEFEVAYLKFSHALNLCNSKTPKKKLLGGEELGKESVVDDDTSSLGSNLSRSTSDGSIAKPERHTKIKPMDFGDNKAFRLRAAATTEKSKAANGGTVETRKKRTIDPKPKNPKKRKP